VFPVLLKLSSWLTSRRVRVHATILAICLWTIYAYDMATPGLRDRNGLIKGTDFLHFYTLGATALRSRGDWLFNMQAQSALAAQLVPGSAGTLFLPLYGPQVSLCFAPLALLPYGWAFLLWMVLNVSIYFACCWLAWNRCANLQTQKGTVMIAAAAFPGFVHLVAWGQTSGLALLCFTFAFLALQARKLWLAGLALGGLAFKPQLALAAALVLVLAREGRILLAAAGTALAQLAAGWIAYGTDVMRQYASALLRVNGQLTLLEPRPYQTHCLKTFWSMLLRAPHLALGFYVITASGVLLVAWRAWKASGSLPIRYSVLLFATVLVSPHLTVYDLVILAPAFLILADWAVQHRGHPLQPSLKILLYLCYPLFLIGPWAQTTHVQLSVLAMIAIFWIASRIANQAGESGDERGRNSVRDLPEPG